jgi:dipeptidyl aminopeptidase/acylaminoacyl peptidase
MGTTVKAAVSLRPAVGTAIVSANASALAEGVKAMFITKLKSAMAVVVLFAIVAFGGGLVARHYAVAHAGQVAKPVVKEGRIYFWLDQRLASVQPDGKDRKWHSKRMVNSSGLPNVALLGNLRISPDGRHCAFIMGGTRVGEDDKTDIEVKLRVLGLDKEGPIIDLGRYANEWAWSPGGDTLAFSMVEYDDAGDRFDRSSWMIDVKTKKKTTLKVPEGHIVRDWSSEGKWFLTTTSINAKEAKVKPARDSADVTRIYLVKQDGSEARPLTDLEFSASAGRFSPDGRQILFHGRDPKGDTWHIYAMDLKTRKPRKVSQELDGGLGGACWSPDGKRIAYVWVNASDKEGDGQTETILMVADVDGKNSATLLSEKRQRSDVSLWSADWR